MQIGGAGCLDLLAKKGLHPPVLVFDSHKPRKGPVRIAMVICLLKKYLSRQKLLIF